MPCYMASQIVIFSDCSLCRTLLRGLLLENGAHHADPEVSALVTDSATGDLQVDSHAAVSGVGGGVSTRHGRRRRRADEVAAAAAAAT